MHNFVIQSFYAYVCQLTSSYSLALPHIFTEKKGLLTLMPHFVPNSKNGYHKFTFLKAGYNQRNMASVFTNHMHSDAEFVMAFCHCSWLFDPNEVAGRTLSTRNWYMTMYTCGLFTASTLLINYLLHIPLEQKSASSVTRKESTKSYTYIYFLLSSVTTLPLCKEAATLD